MGLFALNFSQCLVCVMVVLPRLCVSQYTFTSSRATFYGSPDCYGTPSGACGFGEYGRTVNDGYVSAVSRLYKNGTGCGACYQVKCTKPQCSDEGANIVVTDYGEGDKTDFILNTPAYAKLARSNMALELFASGVVDIEYRRISCRSNNLELKVHESSRFPDYFAVVILNQPVQNEIVAIDLWQEDCQEWRGMRRAYGAVWDMPNPPSGSMTTRFKVSSYGGLTWVQAKGVFPSDWKPGVLMTQPFN